MHLIAGYLLKVGCLFMLDEIIEMLKGYTVQYCIEWACVRKSLFTSSDS